MSRVQDAFKNGKAFIPFITAGDPSLAVTERLVPAMQRAGADLIELGIPFSDPVAEGSVIQEADGRALAAGTTSDRIFESVGRIRKETDVPLAFMTYINPIYVYGADSFVAKCAEFGVDALIVPDLPYEEKEELKPVCDSRGVELISLIAPTSHARIRTIAGHAEGFVYCVSSLGVTGVRDRIVTDIGAMVSLVKQEKEIPCAVGFGVSTPEQAAEIAKSADGVIVGSAIVKLIARYGEACIEPVCDYVRGMKEAIGSCR